MPSARLAALTHKLFFMSALLLPFLCASVVVADPRPQAPEIRFENPFERIGPLSHQMGGINDIIQDRQGFIWFAAENGLGRYDGRSLKLYQSDPQSEASLPSSYLWQLAVDHDGVLWQGGEGGLSHYNVWTDDFTRITAMGGVSLASETISALTVADDNTLYAGGARRLYVISADRDSMREYVLRPPVSHGPNVEQIRSLAIDDEGRVWVATAGMGVAIFDPTDKSFEYLLHDPDNANSLSYNSVRSIIHDDQGRVWMGTYGNGITRLDPKTGLFEHFSHDSDDPATLRVDIVLDILQDSEGTIWVALDQGGLARFDEQIESFHHYLNKSYDPQSLVSNQLRAIYEDRNQDLWLGAFPSGASYYNRSTRIFRHYTARSNDPDSISHNAILRFLEAKDGTIWIGTEGGLNALNPKTGNFKRYLSNPDDPQALKANPVLSLEESNDGHLWVGTWAGGLHRFDPDTGNFQRYRGEPETPGRINGNFIWDLLLDSDDTLWIATEREGLNRYHRDSDSFSRYMHDPENSRSISGNYVVSLLEDREGKLWVGTFMGLDIFDPTAETFTHVPHNTGAPEAMKGRHVRSLFEDSRGRVWVGTQSQGASIYDPDTGTFSFLDVPDGLPSSNVSSIIEDDQGAVWLATTNGLTQVEPGLGRTTTYSTADGLAGSHFNRDASLKDRDGQLYFGSSEGITVFDPRDLDQPGTTFPVVITKLRILNQEITVGNEQSRLSQSIMTSDKLTLDHTDTMFSFDFTALNYRRRDSIRYSYQLEGFDQDWNNVGHNPTATYTNIGPGQYHFRTRASTNGEHWIEGQSLAITIQPSPWRSWWAYSLYAIIIGALLLFAHRYSALRIRAEAYRNKSMTDPLTHLHNRSGIAQVAAGIFANPTTKEGMCLMLLDIDHFKRVNDRRGHDAGDRILADVARVAKDCLRTSDHFGRWGGEEFILLCPTHDSDNSHVLAEKLREAVESHLYERNARTPVRITVSIGVADLRSGDNFEHAFKRADKALYKAKDLGRNCVVVAE